MDFENCENLCAESALPSQIVITCSTKHSDIFEISDRLFKITDFVRKLSHKIVFTESPLYFVELRKTLEYLKRTLK